MLLDKEKGDFFEVDIFRKKYKEELLNTIDGFVDLVFETNENQNKYKEIGLEYVQIRR